MHIRNTSQAKCTVFFFLFFLKWGDVALRSFTECTVYDLGILLTWDVGQHDDDEAVVVIEGHVILVGEPHGVHSSSAYERQSSING